MEEKKATQIAATEVDINTLYGLYLLWSKNDDATQDDFLEFVQSPSTEREAFLEEYCEYQFIEVGTTTVLKLELK